MRDTLAEDTLHKHGAKDIDVKMGALTDADLDVDLDLDDDEPLPTLAPGIRPVRAKARMAQPESFDDLGDLAVASPRHSIRPRRVVTEDLEDAQADAAAPKSRPKAKGRRRTPRPAPLVPATQTAPTPAPTAEPQPPAYVPDPDMPRWHELSLVEAGSRRTAKTSMPVVDAARDSTSVRAFDLLRTRLRQTTQENGWTNIAIVSPTSGCGNTFTAVNLALSLSRIAGSRTVLMDMNLRRPGVAQAFDMSSRGSMQDFLSGRVTVGDHMVRLSDTLALGLNNSADQNAAETLQAPQTAKTLARMRDALQPELVLYDMPAMLVHDDMSAFLGQIDGVLMVSDGTQTSAKELLECERLLEGQVPLLGVVLNRARANSVPHYN